MAKRILISGAARGLGLELSRELSQGPNSLFLLDYHREALQAAKAELASSPSSIETLVCDLSNQNELETMLQKFEEPIDLLINNAGVVYGGKLHTQTFDQVQNTFAVNTIAPIQITQFFISLALRKKKPLQILNIASVSALLGFQGAATYGASKWALLGFSEAIYREYQKSNDKLIRISVAAPSYIQTPLFSGAKPPRLTSFLEPRKLAREILEAAQKNKFLLIRPRLLFWIPFLKFCLGFKLWNKLLDILDMDSGMKKWKGRS